MTKYTEDKFVKCPFYKIEQKHIIHCEGIADDTSLLFRFNSEVKKQLEPTNILTEYHPYINGGGGRLERENYKGQKFAVGSCGRSKTFPGIAKAMAEQWG